MESWNNESRRGKAIPRPLAETTGTTMILLKDARAGETIWECESGRNFKHTIIETPTEVKNRIGYMDGWETWTKEGVHLFQSDEAPYYLKLYREPQYA
jgi:hypothetical protein